MKKIRLTSRKSTEFDTKLKLKGISYHIQTEEGREKYPFITTTAFLGGTVVEVFKTPYPIQDDLSEEVLKTMMSQQHNRMIDMLKSKHSEEKKERNEYIRDIKKLMKKKKWRDALSVIETAVEEYPDDAFMRSYYGYLKGAVEKDYKEGILICKKALNTLRERMPVGSEFYYPVFYLNLGRVYQLSGRKDIAIDYFRKGLEYDQENKELMNELIRLGIRKRPPIPFLSRNNFLNKYLGKMLSKTGLR